jgi:hypothetical protein
VDGTDESPAVPQNSSVQTIQPLNALVDAVESGNDRMASSGTMVIDGLPRVRQNWVLSPALDVIFIIATPIVCFLWASSTFLLWGTSAVVGIFAVFNLSHHLPTFIRIYGDRDLLRRFRWQLLLGPLIPFTLAMTVVSYVILGDYPFSSALCVTLILIVWDPWHFLMQHYGFMRIYDRHNAAPRKLAARMDLSICAIWFVYVMLATVHWFPDLVYDFVLNHDISVLFVFGAGLFQLLEKLTLALALIITIVYFSYTVWCYSRGYFVSPAKLMLTVTTLGMLFLTYVPNPLMQKFIPGWSFPLGFATLGMVHVSQYLAIVWKYNRSLAQHSEKVRSTVFYKTFARGGLVIALGYVALCLLYGVFLGDSWHKYLGESSAWLSDSLGQHWTMWLLGVLFSLNFTSTLLHYYYDGFIWKFRHRENKQHLAAPGDEDETSQQGLSWWDSHDEVTVRGTLFRQFIYFGFPMTILAFTHWSVQEDPVKNPIAHVQRSVSLYNRGLIRESVAEGHIAIAAAERQLAVERQMIDIRPRALHFSYLADLIYIKSYAEKELVAGFEIQPNSDANDLLEQEHKQNVRQAIEALEQALRSPGPYGHRENPNLQRSDIEEKLALWRKEVGAN